MQWTRGVVFSGLLAWAGLLSAQAQQLTDYLAMAMAHDAVFSAARFQRDADANYRIIGAAGLKPTVNLSASTGAGSYQRQDLLAAQSSSSDYKPTNWSVQLTQPLYDPEKTALATEGELRSLRADLVLQSAQQELALRLANAWFGYLLDIDQVALAQAQLASLELQKEQAQRMWVAGVATRTDVEETASRALVAAADLIGAQASLALATRNFARIVGVPPSATLRPSDWKFAPGFAGLDRPLDSWVALARQNSLAVQVQKLSLAIGRAQVAKARAGLMPNVALVASHQNGRTPNYFTASESTSQIAIQLSMNLYAGGGTTAQVQQADLLLSKADQDYLAAQEEAALKVADAALAVEASMQRVAALEKAQRAAMVALEGMTAGQTAGIRTNTDVLNATQQLFVVKRDLARERYATLLRNLERRLLAGDDLMSVMANTANALIAE